MASPILPVASTRAEAIARVADSLTGAGIKEAKRDARALLLAAAGLALADLILDPDAPLGAAAARRLAEFACRRAAREPVSRILGARGFWTLDLLVAPHVLDPRPDTETVVEFALDLLRARGDAPIAILDLGSGSGAILCALLAEFPAARGVAVDLSPRACAASAENLARCGFTRRASVLCGRWAGAISARFDLVVSNPPYVRAGDIAGLDPEVREHDPRLALDGGVDGLDSYREIAGDLPRLLKDGGAAVFEVGAGQAGTVGTLLAAQGLVPAGARRDAGGTERAVGACKPSRKAGVGRFET